MKWIILIVTVFGLCYGEAPVFGGAPYPASGWKPDGATFRLPTEYGAPVQQPHASEIEITKETIEYAGMLDEPTTTVATPSNTYLPPDNDATTTELPEAQPDDVPEFINVQGLPKPQAAKYRVRADFRLPQQQFRQQPQQQQQFRQQQQQFRQQPQQQQQFRQQSQQQFRGNFRQPASQQSQFRGNLRQFQPQPQPQPQGFNQQPNEFAEFIPQNQADPAAQGQFAPNGRLQAPRQQQNFNFRPQQQFGRLELTPPATSYGVPQTQYGPPPQEAIDASTTVNPNEETTDSGEDESEEPPQGVATEDYDDSSEGGPVVAISNASDNVSSQGQYYILAPDNTLQKVMFMTSRTEDDRRNNGFSAQLKYSPVAPIRDPIYAYNEQGQLVRIYRKK